jgi:integrase/recombinase XerD
VTEAIEAWLQRSTSVETRKGYATDLTQFLDYLRVPPDALEQLMAVRPAAVSGWRDQLAAGGLTAISVRRKLTCLRSLFSFLQNYGYLGANPAHTDFVEVPCVPRDGKTVGLTPADCRRLLDAPDPLTPVGIRDRALLAVLAYSACRVGELLKLRTGDYKSHLGHKVLEVRGKGNKERRVALHPEAVERLEAWLAMTPLAAGEATPVFRPPRSSRGEGRDGFKESALSVRATEYLVSRYVAKLGLDPAITVHSFRVTALTTARERGADLIDLQNFAGHADPRTTLTYIRQGERLSKSPTYVLKY